MLEESIIHTIHIVGGTWKSMNNTQSRIQINSNLSEIYTAYIAKKWDQNEKGNKNSPHYAEKSPQYYHFYDNILNQYQYCAPTID